MHWPSLLCSVRYVASYQTAVGQSEAHGNGGVYPLHHRSVHLTHPLPQPPLIQRTDLLLQDHRILGQAAALGRHLDMGGQLGLPRLGGDGRCDDGGAVAVAGVVLHDEHRTHATLLTAHHRAEIGIVDLSTSDIGIHKVHTPPEEVPAAAGQLHSPTQPPDLYAAGENP